MLPPHAKRIMAYLEAIDEAGGRANKTDLFRVGGNVANRDRMIDHLIERNLITETKEGDHAYYSKTKIGQNLHTLMKDHQYFGTLFEELGRSRLRPP
jgi:predicted transcriptional regulator